MSGSLKSSARSEPGDYRMSGNKCKASGTLSSGVTPSRPGSRADGQAALPAGTCSATNSAVSCQAPGLTSPRACLIPAPPLHWWTLAHQGHRQRRQRFCEPSLLDPQTKESIFMRRGRMVQSYGRWLAAWLVSAVGAISARAEPPKPVDFAHDVAPLIKARCAECHTNG